MGNTILGRNNFESKVSLSSVTSVCEKETSEFGGLNLAVIDTPGVFDTHKTDEEVLTEITKCICMAAPGPHAILIVIQPTRFTEEQKSLKMIQELFGEKASNYTMILFTQGDVLKKTNTKIEALLQTSQPLKHFISGCSILKKFEDEYHVFDNTVEDPAQVRGLVEKIQRMVKENGKSCYTNDLFKETEKAKQKEKERLLRENPGMNPQEATRRAERDEFIRTVGKTVAGAFIGASLGAGLGALGIVGAGAAVGALVGAAVALKKNGCIIQ